MYHGQRPPPQNQAALEYARVKTGPGVQQRRSSQERPTENVEGGDMPDAITEADELCAVLASTGPDAETALAEAAGIEASGEEEDGRRARESAAGRDPRDELLRVYVQ